MLGFLSSSIKSGSGQLRAHAGQSSCWLELLTIIDGRAVGAGAGRQARLGELGGGRMGKGESFSVMNYVHFHHYVT